ncbi:MAG: VPLPA-CTERM sorting domain-containing protein [Gammaproteobacteria bacterium]
MRTPTIYLTIAIIALSTSASAAFYDFAAQGDAYEYGYYEFNTATDVNSIYKPGSPDYIGPQQPNIKISASNGSGENYAAYFDSPWTKNGNTSLRDAGLGVCHINGMVGTACAGNSDDNQMAGEYIHMAFEEANLSILSLNITGDHEGVAANSSLKYRLNDGDWEYIDIAGQSYNDSQDAVLNAVGSAINTLDYTIVCNSADDCSSWSGQMYLSSLTTSAVPVPAAFWLFGTALIGFIGFSRRTTV